MRSVLLSLFLLLGQDPRTVFHSQNKTVAGGGNSLTGTFHGNGGFSCTNGGTTCTTNSFAITAGDLVICYVASTQTTSQTLSCTDSLSDTFATAAGPDTNGTSAIGQMFYATASGTSATATCTPTVSNSALTMAGSCMSITVTGTILLDKHPAGASFTATTAMTTAASGTTRSANEVLFACFAMDDVAAQSGAPTAGSGWLNLTNSANGTINQTDSTCEWQGVSSTGSYTGTATASANVTGVGHIATFD